MKFRSLLCGYLVCASFVMDKTALTLAQDKPIEKAAVAEITRQELSPPVLANESPGGLHRLLLTPIKDPSIIRAMATFRESKSDEDIATASQKLLQLAEKANEDDLDAQVIEIAKQLFLSSAPGEVRSRALGLLQTKVGSQYLAPHLRELRVRVPNVSCYGRLSDWLNATFRDQHDWIHAIQVRNTDRVGDHVPAGEMVLGTEAEITFVVDQQKQEADLAKLLIEHKLSHWVLQVDRKLDEFELPVK